LDHDHPERSSGCTPRSLAQSAVGQVLVCEHCRQMHLQVGPLTLRLTHEAFGDLAALLQSAQRVRQAQPLADVDAGAAMAAAVWH
jgi:hypothetical protein